MIQGAAFPVWQDSEWVLISALEHWSYCPRQCALIHLEQTFDENLYTLRGRSLHERVDEPGYETLGEVRIERGLPLWSNRLGLIGKADVVEFHGPIPYPVEYKHGPKRQQIHVDLQLCAQALCLEEMTGQHVLKGAIFHHASRKRREVLFDVSLRRKVEGAIQQVRQMLHSVALPPAVNDARCTNCSLKESCLPSIIGETARLRTIRKALFLPENCYYDERTT